MDEKAALEATLPEPWSISSKHGAPVLMGVYEVRGWAVRITADPMSPWNGPSEIEVFFSGGGDLDGSLETDGITFDVLRDVPLQEARRVISAYGPRLRQALGLAQAASHLPERVETDLDYARMAKRYVELVETGRRNPIGELAELAGVSRNTMSARIRRARDKGFLEGPEGKPATHLTSKAREVLSQVDPSGPPF